MGAILSILIVLICIVLILAVLVQNPKGGGLASGFSSGSQVMGVRRTADFLEKATWTLAVFLFIFSVATTTVGKGKATAGSETSVTKDQAGAFENAKPGAQQNAPQQPGGFGGAQPMPAGQGQQPAPPKPNK